MYENIRKHQLKSCFFNKKTLYLTKTNVILERFFHDYVSMS